MFHLSAVTREMRLLLGMVTPLCGIWPLCSLAYICFLELGSELCPSLTAHLLPTSSLLYSFTQVCQFHLFLLFILALKHKNMVRSWNLYRHESPRFPPSGCLSVTSNITGKYFKRTSLIFVSHISVK